MRSGRQRGKSLRIGLNILQQLAAGQTVMVVGGRLDVILNNAEILKLMPPKCLSGLHFWIADSWPSVVDDYIKVAKMIN